MPAACCAPPAASPSAASSSALVPAALKSLLKTFKDPEAGLTWVAHVARLPCLLKVLPHSPFFRPFCILIFKQTAPGAFLLVDRPVLDPSLWAPNTCDALPPLEKVLEAAAAMARKVAMSPSALLLSPPLYVAGVSGLLAPLGVRVAAVAPGDAAALEAAADAAAAAAGDQAVAMAPRISFVPSWPVVARPGQRFPLLREAAPRLRDAHLRAFFALANDFVALTPWGAQGLDERVLLRVYFPGGAEPAPGYKLPPGEVFWVQINGQDFLRTVERARAAAPPGAPIRLQGVDRDFGLRVFLRRSDAEGFLLAPMNNQLQQLRMRKEPPPHPGAGVPAVARPAPVEAQCLVCGAARGRRCEKCGGVAYCGAACAAANAEAHKPVCSPAARVVPGAPPRAQVAGSTLKVRLFELHEAPLGEVEEVGRVGGALADGEDVPVALMELREGGVARPPLLELARLIRALGVVTAFLRDREAMVGASVPRPSAGETFVPFSEAPRRLGGAFCWWAAAPPRRGEENPPHHFFLHTRAPLPAHSLTHTRPTTLYDTRKRRRGGVRWALVQCYWGNGWPRPPRCQRRRRRRRRGGGRAHGNGRRRLRVHRLCGARLERRKVRQGHCHVA